MSWSIFYILIAGLLVFDLLVVNKKDKALSFRQSFYLSLFYFIIACLFSFYIFYTMGEAKTREYFTCFLIEKAMALDNIFIISMVFQFFAIPLIFQHRILFIGVLGVIIFRAIMIYFGVILITKFSWILYIFAILLIITGIKTFYISDKQFKVQDSYIYKALQKYLNLTAKIEGHKFFLRINGKLCATPLLAALLIIEIMDLVFAIDSIPAIFAITTDPYIIYTSNIFAILGLRSLFFCLAHIVERFHYIKYSMAIILIFIGTKIFASHFIGIPNYVSLIVTIGVLSLGIIISMIKKN